MDCSEPIHDNAASKKFRFWLDKVSSRNLDQFSKIVTLFSEDYCLWDSKYIESISLRELQPSQLRTICNVLFGEFITNTWQYSAVFSSFFFFFLFVSCVTVSISLLMLHLISFSQHFIDHVFISISFSPQFISSIVFIFALFGCTHITWSINLIVSFTFQPIPSLEINDLWVSLGKCLILDRYSLLEAELQWFYYSFSLYIKQEMQYLASFVSVHINSILPFLLSWHFFLHFIIPLVTFPPFRLIYDQVKSFELIIFHLHMAHLI